MFKVYLYLYKDNKWSLFHVERTMFNIMLINYTIIISLKQCKSI